jgi:SHAQKYF class myb-like DNA-binding protein
MKRCSRWTGEEHRLFLEGIMLYGKDWKRMQPLIKTRSLVQIRTHAQKVFKNLGLKKIGPGTVIEAEAAAAVAAAVSRAAAEAEAGDTSNLESAVASEEWDSTVVEH